MARKNKIGLKFDGWEEYMAKLDELGGVKSVRKGVEEALVKSKEYITPQVEKAMTKLPAGGKYSTGRTVESIDRDMYVEWDGLTGYIHVGFNLDKTMTSIFLMHGTPKMKPVPGLKAAIYGAKTKKEIAQIQQEVIIGAIKKIMEG